MRRPILMVLNAGFGETPVPADALLRPGETITAARTSAPTVPLAVVCIAVVPKGCCVDYAIADQAQPKQPRPLMIRRRKAYSETVYVLKFEKPPDQTFPTSDDPEIVTHSELLTGMRKAEAAGATKKKRA